MSWITSPISDLLTPYAGQVINYLTGKDTSLVPRFGRYAGPNYSAGFDTRGELIDPWFFLAVHPIDPVDAVAWRHDINYILAAHFQRESQRTILINQADGQFIRELKYALDQPLSTQAQQYARLAIPIFTYKQKLQPSTPYRPIPEEWLRKYRMLRDAGHPSNVPTSEYFDPTSPQAVEYARRINWVNPNSTAQEKQDDMFRPPSIIENPPGSDFASRIGDGLAASSGALPHIPQAPSAIEYALNTTAPSPLPPVGSGNAINPLTTALTDDTVRVSREQFYQWTQLLRPVNSYEPTGGNGDVWE